jgi:predicted N-acyltransferase
VTIEARILPSFAAVERDQWDRLDHEDNPFLSHAFLSGLESCGCIGAHNGWQPRHLAVYDGADLAAFAPCYVKTNSHGEFVFDWAWADAYHRHGRDYYPKLLTAVPYSPVTGPRLLTRGNGADAPALKRRLVEFATEQCGHAGLSSWHCNFARPADQETLAGQPLLDRVDWQFHWINRGYRDFDDFLAGLRSRKRKNIRKERRQVREAGVHFEWKRGRQLDPDELDFVHRCYLNTFRAYGNHPALNRDFFAFIAAELDERFLVALARRENRLTAMSLFLAGGGRLYGRYWGCLEELPGLHFEAAYYQGIDHCIRQGIEVFESGAQGEHKISRGFAPVETRSFHFIRDEAFRGAIAEYLAREHHWMDEYGHQLERHVPYRRDQQ